jgi:hypothetical protein
MHLGLNLGLSRPQGGSAAFDPVTLFDGGEDGAFYIIHPDYCFQDAAGSTSAGVGDPVARVTDQSGNGNHLTTSISGGRPVLRQNGSLYYLEFDTTDDALRASGLDLEGLTFDVALGYDPQPRDFMLFNIVESGQVWGGIGQEGSSSTTLEGSRFDQNALYWDNVLSTATTRGGQWTDGQAATRGLVNATAANVGEGPYTYQVGDYNNTGSFTTPGDLYSLFVRVGTLTSEERANLDSYLQTVTP